MNASKPVRFLTLDAMRGLAAILVILYHFSDVASLAPSGYLAVDFFFLLSGLVIAKTYRPRFEGGMSVGTFMTQRVIRLYPIFVLGMAIGILRMAGQIAAGLPARASMLELITSSFFGLLFLPNPFSSGGLFPANGPAWSLFFELLANILYAVFIVRASSRKIVACLAVLTVAMIWLALTSGQIEGGQSWSSFHLGFIRVAFSFTLGCMLAKLLGKREPIESRWAILLAAVLCLILVGSPSAELRPYYDSAMVLILFPLIVWISARINPPAILDRGASLLGEISYPMYIIHYPVLYMASFAARKLHLPAGVLIAGFVVGISVLAYWISRYYDPAARRFIAVRISSRNRQAAQLRVGDA